jgi:hypothetical protein
MVRVRRVWLGALVFSFSCAGRTARAPSTPLTLAPISSSAAAAPDSALCRFSITYSNQMPAEFELVMLQLQVDSQVVLRTGGVGLTRAARAVIWEGNRPPGAHALILSTRFKVSGGALAGYRFRVNATRSVACTLETATRVDLVSFQKSPLVREPDDDR